MKTTQQLLLLFIMSWMARCFELLPCYGRKISRPGAFASHGGTTKYRQTAFGTVLRSSSSSEENLKSLVESAFQQYVADVKEASNERIMVLLQKLSDVMDKHMAAQQEESDLQQKRDDWQQKQHAALQEHDAMQQKHVALLQEHDTYHQERDALLLKVALQQGQVDWQQERDALQRDQVALQQERVALHQEQAAVRQSLEQETAARSQEMAAMQQNITNLEQELVDMWDDVAEVQDVAGDLTWLAQEFRHRLLRMMQDEGRAKAELKAKELPERQLE